MLNALDGLALSHALQPAPPPEKLAEWLTLAQEDARQRNRTEASFFHAVAEIDAERTAALWACLIDLPHAPSPLTDAAAREQLRQRYAALRQRLGTAREWDSVANQLDWLHLLWPRQEDTQRAIHDALGALRDALRALA